MTLVVDIRKALSARFSLDVAFSAADGITNLFGASGSGKTTILRAIAGLIRPDDGRVVAGDRVLFDATAGIDVAVRHRRIGYVFQQPALFPHLTIEDNIAFGLHRMAAPEQRRRVEAIAASFRIADLLKRRPSQVSGGERQRAALARSLVTEPSLLLLDEPLSALDHAIQSRIIDDLRAWNAAHRIPMLYVTHSHREVFGLGDHVVILDRGRVLKTGAPHQVLDHPSHAVVANLAGFENVFDAVVLERRERAGTMQCRVGTAGLELEVPLTDVAVGGALRVAIRAGDILLSSQQPHGLSARNVFPGTVLDLVARGATMVASVDAGERLVVHLTPGGVESLRLQRGQRVWLVIKTYSCRTARGGS